MGDEGRAGRNVADHPPPSAAPGSLRAGQSTFPENDSPCRAQSVGGGAAEKLRLAVVTGVSGGPHVPAGSSGSPTRARRLSRRPP